MKKISILFSLVFLFLVFGFSVARAQFDTATGVPVNLKADYPTFVTDASAGIAGIISNIYTYALSIAGILAIIMIVYGGLSYALQPGNSAKQNDAKDIMQSAVWGIVLLAGAYVILKAINPDLVILRNPGFQTILQLDTLDLGTIGDTDQNDSGTKLGGTTIGCTSNNTDMDKNAQRAQKLLNLKPEFSPNTKCPTNSLPEQNVKDVANISAGGLPKVCDDLKCGCAVGGTTGKLTLCPSTLEGLIAVQTKANDGIVPKFRITSLMGDTHSNGSTHYQGRGVDVTAYGDKNAWFQLMGTFYDAGATPMLEYKDSSGSTKFIYYKDTGSSKATSRAYSGNDLASGWCQGCENQHIHMNFGGADSLGTISQETLQGEAEYYLSLHPNLLNNGSYGVPALDVDTPNKRYSCTQWPIDPKSAVQYVSIGQNPFVCDGSKVALSDNNSLISECSCSKGGQGEKKTLHEDVFKVLVAMEEAKTDFRYKLPDFQIVTLMGGIHVGETVNNNIAPSRHYSGAAFDIIPVSGKKSDFQKLKDFIENGIKEKLGLRQGYFATYEWFSAKAGLSVYRLYSEQFSESYPATEGCTTGSIYNVLSDAPLGCSMLRLHVIAHQG